MDKYVRRRRGGRKRVIIAVVGKDEYEQTMTRHVVKTQGKEPRTESAKSHGRDTGTCQGEKKEWDSSTQRRKNGWDPEI